MNLTIDIQMSRVRTATGSVPMRCLDPGTVEGMSVSHIDGRPMLLGGIEIWISVSERKLNPVAS